MTDAIGLILLGILSVPSLILAKKPDAKELLDQITPYQGWIGVMFAFWGIWGIISCVLSLGLLSSAPLAWILWFVTVVTTAVLGFILGYGLIMKYLLSKNETAKEKGEQLLAKLTPLQGKFGIVAIVLGIVYLLFVILL